jgi:putative membrane protein
MILWCKAFHVIAMVAWFAGLFYLPRLFVYHRISTDNISIERFKIMEWRLYYAITWPAGIVTTILGYVLLYLRWDVLKHQSWIFWKLRLIVLLWGFHLACGHYLKQFARNKMPRNEVFFRVFNEVPTVLLISIIILTIVYS